MTQAVSKTTFCYAKVDLWDGLAFHIDGNSKISCSNGTYAEPKPNALSLPHIATCPGSTERCRASCYVYGLKKHAPDVYQLYELNELSLHRILMSFMSRARAAEILGKWIRANARGGFRWHVSGDIISDRHADWIVTVCRLAHPVPFWIYTRTLDVVDRLVESENLAVNVSLDLHNYARGVGYANLGARICYLVSAPDEAIPVLPPGSVIFPDYPLRGRALEDPTSHPWWQGLSQEMRRMVCPADFFGQSENHRCGPCDKCLKPARAT